MEHPITPPPELVNQWETEMLHESGGDYLAADMHWFATQAARWGADQELEACCEWMRDYQYQPYTATALQNARRPKPPSLKEQALEALEQVDGWAVGSVSHLTIHDELVADVDVIRRALESLPDPQD